VGHTLDKGVVKDAYKKTAEPTVYNKLGNYGNVGDDTLGTIDVTKHVAKKVPVANVVQKPVYDYVNAPTDLVSDLPTQDKLLETVKEPSYVPDTVPNKYVGHKVHKTIKPVYEAPAPADEDTSAGTGYVTQDTTKKLYRIIPNKKVGSLPSYVDKVTQEESVYNDNEQSGPYDGVRYVLEDSDPQIYQNDAQDDEIFDSSDGLYETLQDPTDSIYASDPNVEEYKEVPVRVLNQYDGELPSSDGLKPGQRLVCSVVY
jgi:hypothetical protein